MESMDIKEAQKAVEQAQAAVEKAKLNVERASEESLKKWAEWAGTPGGMAITLRRSELAETPQDREYQQNLLARGQAESAKEYADRSIRWPEMDVRGPANAVPLPKNAKVSDLILNWGLMACYRAAEPSSRIKVSLLRMQDNNPRRVIRKTMTLDLPETVEPGRLTFNQIIASLRESNRSAVLDEFVNAEIPDEGSEQADD